MTSLTFLASTGTLLTVETLASVWLATAVLRASLPPTLVGVATAPGPLLSALLLSLAGAVALATVVPITLGMLVRSFLAGRRV